MVAIDYKKRQSLDQHGINRLKKETKPTPTW